MKSIKLEELDDVSKLIPINGYFRDFYNLGREGEICPRFLLFAAIACLGQVVNRKVFFQRGTVDTFPTLYPNPWIILVAPQGEGHKSSTLRMGHRILTHLPEFCKPKILASKLTPEVLVKAISSAPISDQVKAKTRSVNFLKEPAIAMCYSSELSVLLGKEKYMVGMIPLLTDLYDCPDEWKAETIGRGDDILYNVCLTLFAASTPASMQKILPEDAFAGGFMSRILIIPMPPQWDKEEPDPPPPPIEVRHRVIQALSTLHNVQGEMKWDDEAKEFFFTFYHRKNIGKKKISGPVKAARERKQDHLLRIAILLQLSYTYDELILRKGSIEQALRILNVIEKDSEPIIEYISTPPSMRPAQAILENLRIYKKLTEKQLIRKCLREMRTPKDFEQHMAFLLRGGLITWKNNSKGEIEYEYQFK